MYLETAINISSTNKLKEIVMKHMMILFALVAAVILTPGCDEVVNPTREDAGRGTPQSIEKKAPGHGVIKFVRILREPLGFNSFVEVEGVFEYTVSKKDFVDPTNVELSLRAEAIFTPVMTAGGGDWYVSESSKEAGWLGDDGTMTFRKIYKIVGRNDGVFLSAELLTDGNEVKLASIQLMSKKREVSDTGMLSK